VRGNPQSALKGGFRPPGMMSRIRLWLSLLAKFLNLTPTKQAHFWQGSSIIARRIEFPWLNLPP
jgi:hypothetical protein